MWLNCVSCWNNQVKHELDHCTVNCDRKHDYIRRIHSYAAFTRLDFFQFLQNVGDATQNCTEGLPGFAPPLTVYLFTYLFLLHIKQWKPTICSEGRIVLKFIPCGFRYHKVLIVAVCELIVRSYRFGWYLSKVFRVVSRLFSTLLKITLTEFACLSKISFHAGIQHSSAVRTGVNRKGLLMYQDILTCSGMIFIANLTKFIIIIINYFCNS
jgi:hypothetical protein